MDRFKVTTEWVEQQRAIAADLEHAFNQIVRLDGILKAALPAAEMRMLGRFVDRLNIEIKSIKRHAGLD